MLIEKRITDRIDKTGTCWLWLGKPTAHGYGIVRWDGRYQGAHRVVYELEVGKIPEGLQLDHLCRVRHCVNPGHLEPVTQAENIKRGLSGKLNNHHAKKTHCPSGHPYNNENTYVLKNNRLCRECRRVRNRERWRATKRGEPWSSKV